MYAPSGTDIRKIVGSFDHAESKRHFEFMQADESDREEYPFEIFVCDGTRQAKILKTVAYVVVDEDHNGPVIEKWPIRNLRNW